MTRHCDVLVAGGGVVGCAVAWSLAREGVSVALLERDDLAAHASGAAAGMLLPFGECEGEGPFLRFALQSLALLRDVADELRERSGIDPELEPSGALHLATTRVQEGRLREKGRLLAAHGLEWLDARATREAQPGLSPAVRGAIWSAAEAHVRSPLLTRAFAGAAAELGARVEIGVSVTGLRRAAGRVTGVETSEGPRQAGSVVLCTGVFLPEIFVALPLEPVRGQILSLDNARPPLRGIVVAEDVYLVPKRDDSVVVGATEERVGFDRRVTAAGLSTLLAAAQRLAPKLAQSGFRGGWAGLRPATPDGLPAIGPVPGSAGLWLAAGHHRNGVLLSAATGRLVAEMVLGKAVPAEADAFRPGRFL